MSTPGCAASKTCVIEPVCLPNDMAASFNHQAILELHAQRLYTFEVSGRINWQARVHSRAKYSDGTRMQEMERNPATIFLNCHGKRNINGGGEGKLVIESKRVC